ncbi:circadian clock KaiB family protein [Kamptonema formosum]|uniref:circadian clock KaiB family protein n=1 Tax=Kamptonema formosum TaxID=331992 RepID=UPI00034DD760|nr:circadian clock KaiB family protein [Oscillatoria sp. PCC 10802]
MRDPSETYGYVLRLFVCGHTAATERTLKRLHQLLQEGSPSPYTLKVIDIFKHPEQTEADRVCATPTLLKVWPQPFRRIVGELDNADAVLRLLSSVDIE